MRRTLGVLVGAGTVLALAGAAGATAYARTGPAQPRATARAASELPAAPAGAPRVPTRPADGARPATGVASAVGPAALPSSPRASAEDGGTQRIGTLETVRQALDYLGGSREATFRYPGASYVKVHFDRLALLPGDHVTVSDPAGTEVHRYDAQPVGEIAALPGRLLGGATGAGGRWAMSVSGDTAVVTLHSVRRDLLGLGSLLDRLGVSVDKVARGYTDAEWSSAEDQRRAAGPAERPAPAGPGREESVCGGDEKTDVVCYRSSHPVAYDRSRAVARLLINGVELCTGWRIGAGNRMLTNNHCFATSADAYQTEVWFNYRCATCGGGLVLPATKVWGDRVLATDRTLDVTLFTVENFEQVRRFGYLTLETRRPTTGEELYIPQHPGGDPMTIAMSGPGRAGNCAVRDPAYDGYATDSDVSYLCDTEGGSSGSPVLSRRTDRVVALHHFGGCPNSGVRADLVYRRIQALL